MTKNDVYDTERTSDSIFVKTHSANTCGTCGEEVLEVSHVLVVRADGHMEANAARTKAITARSECHRRLAQAYLDKEHADNLAKGVPIERFCDQYLRHL